MPCIDVRPITSIELPFRQTLGGTRASFPEGAGHFHLNCSSCNDIRVSVSKGACA
jgi:hypothetical protein